MYSCQVDLVMGMGGWQRFATRQAMSWPLVRQEAWPQVLVSCPGVHEGRH